MSKVELTTKQIKQLTQGNYCIVVGRCRISNLLVGKSPLFCWVDSSGNRTDIYKHDIVGNHPTITVLIFEGYSKESWFKNSYCLARADYEQQKFYDEKARIHVKHYCKQWEARKNTEYILHDFIFECINDKVTPLYKLINPIIKN